MDTSLMNKIYGLGLDGYGWDRRWLAINMSDSNWMNGIHWWDIFGWLGRMWLGQSDIRQGVSELECLHQFHGVTHLSPISAAGVGAFRRRHSVSCL